MRSDASPAGSSGNAGGGDDENYYLYYLLRTFEKRAVEYEDMPRRFLEVCRRKSDYLGQLNRNLGRHHERPGKPLSGEPVQS
ncbi:MAG: hypothetical protein ACLU8D_02820 [Enterocloster sp.]